MRYFLPLLVILILSACNSSDDQRAIQLFEEGEYQKALPLLNDLVGSSPSDTRLLFFRGRCLEEQDRFDEALTDFMRILELDEKSADARLGIAKVRYKQENYEQALLSAQDALKLNPNSADGHFLEARASHMMGYFDKALDSYTSAISINRDYGEAYLYRGAVNVQLDRNRQACEDFNKAKNLEVPNAQSALNRYCK